MSFHGYNISDLLARTQGGDCMLCDNLLSQSLSGHSHQLFHICAVIGTHFQMKALIKDMTLRQAWLALHAPLPSFMDTIGAISLALLLNLLIIALFSLGLYWKPKTPEVKSQHYYTEKLKVD